MRVMLGIILGAILTVSIAFIADSWVTAPTTTTTGSASAAAAHRPMVNWDVVGDNVRNIHVRAHHVWDQLTHRFSG